MYAVQQLAFENLFSDAGVNAHGKPNIVVCGCHVAMLGLLAESMAKKHSLMRSSKNWVLMTFTWDAQDIGWEFIHDSAFAIHHLHACADVYGEMRNGADSPRGRFPALDDRCGRMAGNAKVGAFDFR